MRRPSLIGKLLGIRKREENAPDAHRPDLPVAAGEHPFSNPRRPEASEEPTDSPDAAGGRNQMLAQSIRGRFDPTRAERILAKRLADIDHLRDVAIQNGNTQLLDRADQLEVIARRQFAWRTGGGETPSDEPVIDPLADTTIPDPIEEPVIDPLPDIPVSDATDDPITEPPADTTTSDSEVDPVEEPFTTEENDD